MNPHALIDAIVRQTTVLIARLSTVEGVRSPLGHVANEVFVGLSAELESQGVSKKVIADMFGMALRSYRQKVQRLGESVPSRGLTLWTAVQRYLAESGKKTRTEVLSHFQYNEEASVRGILNDLVESGLLVLSGRGDSATYRVPTAQELRELGTLADAQSRESQAALCWVHIYREGPLEMERLAQLVPIPHTTLEAAVETLVGDGRVSRKTIDGQERLVAEHFLVAVGEAAGWEAAVIDHHRAVLNAIAAKLSGHARNSASADEVGGMTLTFDLWPGHPLEPRVRALLRDTRASAIPLWDEVEAYNDAHAHDGDAGSRRGGAYRVHYYCGQYVVQEDDHT